MRVDWLAVGAVLLIENATPFTCVWNASVCTQRSSASLMSGLRWWQTELLTCQGCLVAAKPAAQTPDLGMLPGCGRKAAKAFGGKELRNGKCVKTKSGCSKSACMCCQCTLHIALQGQHCSISHSYRTSCSRDWDSRTMCCCWCWRFRCAHAIPSNWG